MQRARAQQRRTRVASTTVHGLFSGDPPPPCLQIRRHDEIAKHPEKEKKKAAKAEYDAARPAKAAGRRSEEDAKAAKAAKVKYDFQSFTIFPHPQRSGYSLLYGGHKLELT